MPLFLPYADLQHLLGPPLGVPHWKNEALARDLPRGCSGPAVQSRLELLLHLWAPGAVPGGSASGRPRAAGEDSAPLPFCQVVTPSRSVPSTQARPAPRAAPRLDSAFFLTVPLSQGAAGKNYQPQKNHPSDVITA